MGKETGPAGLASLRQLRKALGLTQEGMAERIGTTVRAIQSYEQGWRPTPTMVRKLAFALLAAKSQKGEGRPKPCWEVRGCAPEAQARCPAYGVDAGSLCWMLTGNCVNLQAMPSWDSKMVCCMECPVLARARAALPE